MTYSTIIEHGIVAKLKNAWSPADARFMGVFPQRPRCSGSDVEAAGARWMSSLAGMFARVALLALAVLLGSVGTASAGFESPVQIAGSTQSVGGGAAAAVALDNGNALVGYRPSEQSIAVRHRDSGSAVYSAPQVLAETSGSNKLLSPVVTEGAQGEAFAAWAFETPKTSEETVSCATRTAGAGTFSPCVSNLLGPPGLYEGNWRMSGLHAAGNDTGTVALSFEGPGQSNGYGFSRPFAAYGSMSGTPATTALTGNIGLFEAGASNAPQVALNGAGDAIAAWTGWPEFPREVAVGYRDHAGSGWSVLGGGGARVYCCSYMGPGNYRLALDAAGDGYVIIQGGAGGGEGNEGVIFAYASRAHALGGAGPWGVQQQLDKKGSAPRIAVDSAGDATAIWIDEDPETHHDALFAAYRPAGPETKFGQAFEVTLAPGSGQISGDEVYVSPSGDATFAWMTCAESGCANREVQARTRAAAGGAFGPIETIEEKETNLGGLTMASDPQGEVLLAWSEGGSNTMYASLADEQPTAAFSVTTATPTASQPVAFDASASADVDGSISSYSWDFGDSTPAGTGATPPHTYSSPGTYTVTLTVSDSADQSSQASHSVTVASAPSAPGGTGGSKSGTGGSNESSTGSHGATTTTSTTPTTTPATALISGLIAHPSSFRVARTGASIASTHVGGTTISYNDSRAATTTFTVARILPGVRSGKQCVAPRHKHPNGKACKRLVPVRGSFTHNDTNGTASFHFTGRVAGRALTPGNYELTALPAAGSVLGKAVQTQFRITR